MGLVLSPADNPFHNIGTIGSSTYGLYGAYLPYIVTEIGLIVGQNGNGMLLADGGTLGNGNVNAKTAMITGGCNGVVIGAVHRAAQYNGPATVTNSGMISGFGFSGVVFDDAGGSVVNGSPSAARQNFCIPSLARTGPSTHGWP